MQNAKAVVMLPPPLLGWSPDVNFSISRKLVAPSYQQYDFLHPLGHCLRDLLYGRYVGKNIDHVRSGILNSSHFSFMCRKNHPLHIPSCTTIRLNKFAHSSLYLSGLNTNHLVRQGARFRRVDIAMAGALPGSSWVKF